MYICAHCMYVQYIQVGESTCLSVYIRISTFILLQGAAHKCKHTLVKKYGNLEGRTYTSSNFPDTGNLSSKLPLHPNLMIKFILFYFSISVHASSRSLLCSNGHTICNIDVDAVYLYCIFVRHNSWEPTIWFSCKKTQHFSIKPYFRIWNVNHDNNINIWFCNASIFSTINTLR